MQSVERGLKTFAHSTGQKYTNVLDSSKFVFKGKRHFGANISLLNI